MASSFEKSVKGATKIKLAAPKSKYVEHILVATHSGEAGIAEVFRALSYRLKDSHWTVVFKALIVVHLMMREGEHNVTLVYLRKHPRLIAISNYSDAAQQHGGNIKHYANYLYERARSYGEVQTDYVRFGEGRLRKLSVDKGLLREVENVQQQLRALLKCRFREDEVDNEIALTAFRLLVMDLLSFFHVVNEGVINVLEHYFEMSKPDAERALGIYKVFTQQTSDVVEYLQVARRLESHTRLQIPNNIKHAPTSLTAALEEYVNDPEFDQNRRQYLEQQAAGKNGGKLRAKSPAGNKSTPSRPPATEAKSSAPENKPTKPTAPAPDLIDFFGSLDKEQTTLFAPVPQQAPVQAYAMAPQFTAASTNPYTSSMAAFNPTYQTAMPQQQPLIGGLPQPQPQQQPIMQHPQPIIAQPTAAPLQANFTGAGFGGYTPSSGSAVAPPVPIIPQQFAAQPQAQQSIPQQQPSFLSNPIQQQQQQQQSSLTLNLPQQTGKDTNPFRQSIMVTGASAGTTSTGPGGLISNPTGSISKGTNPFKQNAASASPVSAANAFAPPPPLPLQQTSTPSAYSLGSQPTPPPTVSPTGTNPFARNLNQPSPISAGGMQTPPPSGGLVGSMTGMGMGMGGMGSAPSGGLNVPMPTGAATNPFRASVMAKQDQIGTGGWDGNAPGSGGLRGLEALDTVPVFPRR